MNPTPTPSVQRLHVIGLEAENVKRLRAVDVELAAGLNVVSGRNGQGKTSLLDALWFALAGAAAQKATPEVIRNGEKRARVTVTLGRDSDAVELVVTRTWKSNGNGTLEVTNAEGAKYPKAQAVLDGLIGRLSFDPLAFAEATPKEQLATLLELVELPFDPAALDAQRRALFDERTDVNREVKRLAAAVDGMPAVPADTPEVEVSTADLLAEHRAAVAAKQTHKVAQDELTDAEARVSQLSDALTVARAELSHAVDRLRAVGDPPDLGAIEARMASVGDVNEAVRARDARAAAAGQLATAEHEAKRLSEAIEAIDAQRAFGVASASMPIDGLGFDDDGVTYGGVPFGQCSGAERLRVSLAMAMAANPTLGLCRIADGSLLDPESLALVAEMADANGFQVVVERVAGSGGPTGIVIEDGRVVGGTAPVVEQAPAAVAVAADGNPFGWLDGGDAA